jgi:hypothetical protein
MRILTLTPSSYSARTRSTTRSPLRPSSLTPVSRTASRADGSSLAGLPWGFRATRRTPLRLEEDRTTPARHGTSRVPSPPGTITSKPTLLACRQASSSSASMQSARNLSCLILSAALAGSEREGISENPENGYRILCSSNMVSLRVP